MKASDVLAAFRGVRPSGTGFSAYCPAHHDRRRSLSLGVGRNGRLLLTCHAGCGLDAILAAAGLARGDLRAGHAPAHVATLSRVGAAEREQLRAYALDCRKRLETERHGRAGHALGYLHVRFRLELDAALACHLGYDPGTPDVDRPTFLHMHDARLVVPLVAQGRLVGLQARALGVGEPRWLGPTGTGWGRAGGFRLDRAGSVIVTEGPSDALAAVGLGYAAVAVRGAGLAATGVRAGRALAEVVDELRGRDVVVAGDGDDAGRRFAANIAATLLGVARSVRSAALPDGLDLAALAHRHGADVAQALLEEAR